MEKIEPDLPDRPGWAPLALACLFSRRAIVAMLLGQGDVNPDPLGPSGMTVDVCCFVGPEKIVRMLIATGMVDLWRVNPSPFIVSQQIGPEGHEI